MQCGHRFPASGIAGRRSAVLVKSASHARRHMKLRNCCLLLVGVCLVASVAAFSREVRTDFDHHANFSQFRTYSFAKVETPDPLWDDRVKTAIDSALTAKGWTRVASGGDVSIVVVGTTRDKPTLRTFYEGFDGWRWG